MFKIFREGLQKRGPNMAPSEAFIRDRVISVFWISKGRVRVGRRVRMNVSNVVRWKLCKRNA